MKKLIIAIVALFTFGAFSASAQKFGHMNYQDVMDTLDTYKEADRLNKEETESFEATYLALQTKLEKDYQTYMASQDTMNKYMRQIEENRLTTMQNDMQALEQAYQQEVGLIQKRYVGALLKWLEEAVDIVGKRKGLDYIMYFDATNPTMWVNPTKGVDVTNEVITEMLILEKSKPIAARG